MTDETPIDGHQTDAEDALWMQGVANMSLDVALRITLDLANEAGLQREMSGEDDEDAQREHQVALAHAQDHLNQLTQMVETPFPSGCDFSDFPYERLKEIALPKMPPPLRDDWGGAWAVRDSETGTPIGLFFAENMDALYWAIDQITSPKEVSIQRVRVAAMAVGQEEGESGEPVVVPDEDGLGADVESAFLPEGDWITPPWTYAALELERRQNEAEQ